MFKFQSIFRLVQMFARRQSGEFLKIFRAQRLGNDVLAAEPFAKVNQFASVRAERPVFPGKPVPGPFACGANGLSPFIWFRWQSF
jgi:hypothetical protein